MKLITLSCLLKCPETITVMSRDPTISRVHYILRVTTHCIVQRSTDIGPIERWIECQVLPKLPLQFIKVSISRIAEPTKRKGWRLKLYNYMIITFLKERNLVKNLDHWSQTQCQIVHTVVQKLHICRKCSHGWQDQKKKSKVCHLEVLHQRAPDCQKSRDSGLRTTNGDRAFPCGDSDTSVSIQNLHSYIHNSWVSDTNLSMLEVLRNSLTVIGFFWMLYWVNSPDWPVTTCWMGAGITRSSMSSYVFLGFHPLGGITCKVEDRIVDTQLKLIYDNIKIM